MDVARFFFGQHAATHAGDVYATTPSRFDRLLGSLSEDQMRVRPRPGLNSIVWLLWHMARTEDVAVNLVVAARAQVFDGAWARRMNVARPDMGTGMTVDEVAELSERADVAGVRAYRSAVGARTREAVGALPPAAWDEILTLEDTARAADAGAFGPNDLWIDGIGHPPWQGHARGDQLGGTAIRHNAGHIGEAVTVRGLGG
ncbi:MAG TPA: DinB family protein [Methylomirabilota bacterium]|nr:DinB family protein [Methylomirabilota bacterium]